MTMFQDKLGATIGPSYILSFLVGGVVGLTKMPPPKNRRTNKLLMNSYLNNIGKTSARFSNNVGGGIFMYLMVGKFINFLFLEELDEVSAPVQNAIFGGLTGALYKCTRGSRAMCLSSVIGMCMGSVYANLYTKGYLSFKSWMYVATIN